MMTYVRFLYADVGQVHKDIVDLGLVVLFGAEAAETLLIEVRLQRTERGHQDEESQIELLAADEEGIVNVLGDHTGVPIDLRIEGAGIVGVLLQLGQLIHQVNAHTLRFAARLDDPCAGRIAMEDFDKHLVVGGQDKGHGYDVQVLVARTTYAQFRVRRMALGQGITSSLQVLAIPLDVLDQQILARQLNGVGEVVYDPTESFLLVISLQN